MRRKFAMPIIALMALLTTTACVFLPGVPQELKVAQTHPIYLEEIRLGDGVPLDLSLTVRWHITNGKAFLKHHASVEAYHHNSMIPRAKEALALTSNQFPSVDSVFGSQRADYLQEVKNTVRLSLNDGLIEIDEIVVPDLGFPLAYTEAKQAVGLRNQELAYIAEQSKIDLAQAAATRKRTDADNKLRIAQAEADGRLQKIQAQMEKDRRASELARAETQRQVAQMNSEAESERRLVLAKADLKKQRDLKNLELEKRREIDRLELLRDKDQHELQHEQQLQLAKLCTDNPVYASFLVNRELAGQVEIAVLPTGTSPNVFKDLLHHTMPSNPKIQSIELNSNK